MSEPAYKEEIPKLSCPFWEQEKGNEKREILEKNRRKASEKKRKREKYSRKS